MKESYYDKTKIEEIIKSALQEDVNTGDITTNLLIPEDKNASAFMKAKESGVVAGMEIAEMVFKYLSPEIEWKPFVKDGDKVEKGTRIAEIKGSYRAILTGERLALNFLQRMSGIASETAKYVELVKESKTEILDTRKTVPGLRILDKYAVKAGGGTNHRIGLYDMVMIKDNHIEVAGSITNAVDNIRKELPAGIKIEVETKNLEEVKEALKAKADVIMLDNMDNATMAEAVKIVDGKAKTEASGNMTLERIKGVSETGVDYISIGALTHSVKALDIGQYIDNN
ncbi:MAG: carboxylating nicotinate-nucleotide diphosphorylase [Rhodothermaceae bacterium]